LLNNANSRLAALVRKTGDKVSSYLYQLAKRVSNRSLFIIEKVLFVYDCILVKNVSRHMKYGIDLNMLEHELHILVYSPNVSMTNFVCNFDHFIISVGKIN